MQSVPTTIGLRVALSRAKLDFDMSTNNYLDFEKPIAELEAKIEELRGLSGNGEINIGAEIKRLENKVDRQLIQTYEKLTPWQKTQVARHRDRPHSSHYVARLMEDFTPLAGDRAFAEDRAIISGLARFRGRAVMLLGHEKGFDTDERIAHNFGMASPEGYRKAARLMKLADRFRLPVVTLVDTPGAYPGVGAEERGQAEAIARAIEACLDVSVPFVSAIIGEGGSGGAVALAVADRVIMLEHAIYSVISPEGCASILWRSAEHTQKAADALKLTAKDLMELGVIDAVIREPKGGAHRDPDKTIDEVGSAIDAAIKELIGIPPGELRRQRQDKYLDMKGNALS